MAKVHILETLLGTDGGRAYRAVIHFNMPGGNNSTGESWKNCHINSGNATTQMTEGTGAGQITAAEKTQIEAGNRVEFTTNLMANTVATNAELEALADAAISDEQDRLSAVYKWYGHTTGA